MAGQAVTYLTTKEARTRLRVSRMTMQRLIQSGDVRASRIGNGKTSPYRIAESDLSDYMDRQTVARSA